MTDFKPLPAGLGMDLLIVQWVFNAGKPPKYRSRADVRRYSEVIEWAWQVADKLAHLAGDFRTADGFFVLQYAESACHDRHKACRVDVDSQAGEEWSAHFHLGCLCENDDIPKHWDHGKHYCARAKTAALAICRAALKAMRK